MLMNSGRDCEELWQRDESSRRADDGNDDLGSTYRAPDNAMHRMTDADVPLDGERHR